MAEPESEAVAVVEESGVKDEGEPSVKRKAPEPQWFDMTDDHNTHVYVSNLPADTSEDDFIALMKKYGLLMKDPDTNQFKVKMYKDREGNFKGDALCSYLKRESVDLALNLLDESDFNGNMIKVERAKFELKGEYDPSKKPRRNKKHKEKMKKTADKLLGWRPEKITDERPRAEKTVIIKNFFDPMEFAKDPRLILDYRNDIRDESEEKCGPVKKVEIFDNNPEGVASVTFDDFQSAEKCVKLMNGRFFAGRQLIAFNWDGRTKFRIEETEEEAEKRMKDWEQFLEKS
ncbi:HIV Tat-specific factor 1 [Halotydeus destructor]|nr:HIV Tat-specific factor 1 [Halotydeus destructor]